MSAALGLIGLTPEEEATLVQLRETEGLKGLYMHEHARSPAEPAKSDEPAERGEPPESREPAKRDDERPAAAMAAAPAAEASAALQPNAALQASAVDDATNGASGVDAAKDARIAVLERERGELQHALEAPRVRGRVRLG